jgi:isopenicillin-N N-acyltransferase-like protein
MARALSIVECRGTPREMGRQYGEQAREEIRRNLELRGHGNSPKTRALAAPVRRVMARFVPEVLEELDGVAEGVNLDADLLLVDNHVALIADVADTDSRCTPVLLNGSRDGTLVAKNNDAPPQEDYAFVVRRCTPAQGIPFVHVTYAGWLSGLDAMNAEGLANTHGSVGSRFDKSGERIDIRLFAYRLLRTCRTTDEWLDSLRREPLTGKGFSIAVGDACGSTAMVDAAVPFIAVRDRNRPFAYSTNLYMAPGLENADARPPEKRPVCVYRYGYLRWIEATRPPSSLGELRGLLASHEPWAPCRHAGPHGSCTVWSMIACPEHGKILVANSNPCENDYAEFGV